MTRDRFWLWVKTVTGLLLVYATWPLAAVVWLMRKLMLTARSRRVLLLGAILALPGALYGGWLLGSRGSAEHPVEVEIRTGTSFKSFADTLGQLGLIRNPVLFRLAARVTGIDRRLHVGLYRIAPDDSPYGILRKLARHDQLYRQFTVVEGAVLREFLPAVAEAIDVALDSLTVEVRRPDRLQELGVPARDLEGYLFPETYAVPWTVDAADVVDAMTGQFEAVWQRVSRGYDGPLTRHEAVTLASLIEAEARDGNERGTISSVFHNRLRRRMKLQCDPTVIYAMGGLDRPLLRKDWEYESPYNTYRVFGLPPGPIAAPGEASLRAALFPEETDYLYFMARGDGTHAFSRTLAEHEAAYRLAKENSR